MTDGFGGDNLGEAVGSLTLDVAQALSALNQVSSGIQKMGSTQPGGGFGNWIRQNEQSITTLGKSIAGFGAVVLGAFGLMTNTAASFEQQMSAVGSVTGSTGETLAAMREEALRLGADTAFGATEAAQAMEIMAKAGASTEQILGDADKGIKGATESILNLSAATGVAVPLAAETAATAMNTFGVSAEEAADIIAQSSNASALDVNDWALALKSAGPVASALGLEMSDLADWMVILGDAGIKGEVGATAMRNILLSMSDPAGEAALALQEYGVATHDANGNMRDMSAITGDLATTWGTLSQAEKVALAQTVAGKDGAAAFMVTMDAQTDALQRNTNAFDEAADRQLATGSASEQAQARMDNFRGSLDELMGAVETVSIEMGSRLLPVLRAVVDGVAGLVRMVLTLPAGLQTAIMAVAGITGVVATLSGGFLLALPKIVEFRTALLKLTKTKSVAAALNAVRVSMLGFLGPIALIVAAAAAIYLAYKTNFLGFADLVDGAVAKVKSLVAVFKAFRQTTNPVTAALKAVGTVFPSLKKHTDSLVRGIEQLQDTIERIGDAFDFYRDRTDLVSAALKSLSAVFPGLRGVIAPVLSLIDQLKTAFSSALATGVNPIHAGFLALGSVFPVLAGYIDHLIQQWKALADAGKSLWDALQALFEGDWEAMFSALGDAAQSMVEAFVQSLMAIGSLIVDVFNAIDWGAVGSALAAGAQTAFWWLVGAFQSVDWGAVGSAILSGIDTAIGWVGDLSLKLLAKGIELVDGIKAGLEQNWPTITLWLAGVGIRAVAAIGDLSVYLLSKGIELMQGLWQGLQNNWPTISAWLLTVGQLAVAAVGDLLATLTQKGVDLVSGMLTGATNAWTGTVMPYLSTRGEQAASLVGDLLATLVQKGTDLVTGLLTGAKNYWLGSVQPYLHERGAQAFASIGALISTLVQKGTDLISGLLTGAIDKWLSVRTWLAERGSQAVSAIGSLITTLLQKGKDLINGLYAGLLSKWNDARSWLSGIPGRASSAVGSLLGVLRSAGANLIQGLINGISGKLGELESLLASVTNLIPDWKGPPERDAKLLYNNGVLIMQGLGRGIGAGWLDVARQLQGMTFSIPDVTLSAVSAGSGHSSLYGAPAYRPIYNSPAAGTVAHTTYVTHGPTTTVLTIPPDEWVKVAKQAEDAPQRVATLMRKAQSLVPY